jgi:sugar phosphate isomerase/epimerase
MESAKVDSPAHPRLAVNAMCMFTWDVDKTIAAYRSLDVHRAIFPLPRLDEDWKAGVASLASAELDFAATILPSAFDLADPASWPAARDRLELSIRTTAELGAPLLYMTTGPSRGLTTDEACARFVAAVEPAVAFARAQGVRVAIENTGYMSRDFGCVQSLRDTIQLAVDADMEVVVELANCWMDRDLKAIFKDGMERFALVEVSDFEIGTPVRLSRRVPGDGDIPLAQLLTDLGDTGYHGMFDLEIMGPHIEDEGYLSATRRGIDYMTELLYRLDM